MINYFYDCYRILNKVYSEKAFIKQAILSVPIEEKNRALTIKTCYGVLDKDIELSYYLGQLCDKNPKLVIRTVLKIAMYAIKYLDKKEYAVTENAVELVKKLGKGGTSGFVNSYLRRFIKHKFIYPTDKAEYLSIKYSYPKFAVDVLIKDFGVDKTEKIISAENGLNTLVFYDTNGEEYLKNKGVNYTPTVFDNVYSVKNFVRNSDYDKGVYTFQALGSVAICDAVEPCENMLDCCSAPGGKAVRLSYKCANVTACELHEHRVELIKDYAIRMKRENVVALNLDATVFNKDFEQAFDGVLCDVPCSGLGVINDNPDIKLNRSIDSIYELNKIQLSILKNASRYVKKGGYLYYSTCSIINKENIDIINAFMSDIKGFEICKIDSKLPHLDINGTNLFLPDISGGLGFYIAKLKRV